ncbi:hypothetical protein DFJ43DRAFT_1127801 [Lentinula guzmanii]|uniref:HMG box domain-containing protein n=1 Tax=Lentinula guzmanii TaxID=2804957 RepID=A0AA38J786_9AGAR|nr:hypothetical protein DFJ43DRAFT_1127801 [Lentinula guzmanii]
MPALRTRDTQSRPLEVTTDAPQPPALTIISPTPRAFTFPISHNLSSDSPYSTPSTSPFEPDLTSLAIFSATSCTPPPRTLSPTSSFTSVSPSPTGTSHLSQKSPTTDAERRPKKGDEDYIKRPENAFILFRRKCCERQAADDDTTSSRQTKKQRQADLSKMISQQWKSLTPEERRYWEEMAKEKKKEHAQMYPDYVFRPQRVRDKDGKARNKKRKPRIDKLSVAAEGSPKKNTESMSFVVAPPRQHGRSASAPTPPPISYQSIQMPNLYSSSPSCPTSPSLLPMISRRAIHSRNPEDGMADFDFMPNPEHLLAPAFGTEQPNLQVKILQSSEFLRNMFNMNVNEGPLTVSTDTSLLLPAHQIVSPASTMGTNSSGPSSPTNGPFTPIHPIPFDLDDIPNACVPDSHMQPELDTQMQMSPSFNFSGNYWPMQSVWQDESNMAMMHNDFDLSSIPSLEMGDSKYVDETNTYMAPPEAMGMGEYHQEYQQDYSNEYLTEYQQDYVQLEPGQYFEVHQSTESSLLRCYDNMLGSPEQSF